MAKPQFKTARKLVTAGDPEQLYPEIPSSLDFEKAECDYVDGADLEKIGEALIEHQGGFGYLRDRKIVYLWKNHGGKKAGKAILGKCQRPSGLLAKFCNADWIVWLAADHHAEFRSTRFQVEATVFHELCHTDVDEKNDAALLVGHDYEGFCREVELYGLWRGDLEKAAQSFEQMKLL
jgi:hypothetical protein